MKIRHCLLPLLLFVISCQRDNLPPVATFTCTPPEGNINTLFDFDATAALDPDGLKTLLTFRWDCNGDGTWETEFGPWDTYAWRYTQPGTYSVRLEVKDGYGAVTLNVFTVSVDSLRTITDPRDGEVYPVVKLGSYWWFARNLNIGKQIDGTQGMTENGVIEKYVYPSSDPDSLNGGLYTWKELMAGGVDEGVQGICPPGWHVPTISDWNNLLSLFRRPSPYQNPSYRISNVIFVPDQLVFHDNFQSVGAGRRLLKETGSTGFNAILTGYRDPAGNFDFRDYYFAGRTATFWTSASGNGYAVRVRIYQTDNYNGDIFRFSDNPEFAFSVRCVKPSL